MSEQTKTQISTFVTLLLTLLFSIPAVAGLFPAGTLAKLQGEVGPVLGAVSTLLLAGTFVWGLLPFSKAKKVVLAAEMPQVSRIVTTGSIANSSKVLKLTSGSGQATVVTHAEAMTSAPPIPKMAA